MNPIFNENHHFTWKLLFQKQVDARKNLIHPMFQSGLDALNITEERIPDLTKVNQILSKLTGFKGVWVEGHEDAKSFFVMLKKQRISNWKFYQRP